MKINKNIILKITIILVLIILFIVLIFLNYSDIKRRNAVTNILDDATTINNNTSFCINSTYLYSSAAAQNVVTSNTSWNLDLYQYTDIALYISATQNVSNIYIDSFSCNNLSLGSPFLYFKNLNNFGVFEETSKTDRIDFEIIPTTQELDFSKPQIYSDLSNPITLEYANLIFENHEINNTNTLTYNGSLLKSAGVTLSSISATISFKIHIITDTNEEHTYPISFEIPLSDSSSSIYNGSFTKIIENSVRF